MADQSPDLLDAQQVTALEAAGQSFHPAPIVQHQPMTPMDMIAAAVQRGATVEEIGKLMDLAERLRAQQAQQAFVAAMAKFKQNPPRIEKNRTADITSKRDDVASYAYKFANLADVCEKIVASLAKVGISHRWKTQQDAGQVAVTCILTHELGHSECTMLSAGLDLSGKKNNLQALGSTVSYLNRYTLLAATGLAVDDGQDTDGATDQDRQELQGAAKEMRQGRNRPNPSEVASRGRQAAPADASLLAEAQAAADKGHAHFGPYWRGLQDEQRKALAADLSALQQRASQAGGK